MAHDVCGCHHCRQVGQGLPHAHNCTTWCSTTCQRARKTHIQACITSSSSSFRVPTIDKEIFVHIDKCFTRLRSKKQQIYVCCIGRNKLNRISPKAFSDEHRVRDTGCMAGDMEGSQTMFTFWLLKCERSEADVGCASSFNILLARMTCSTICAVFRFRLQWQDTFEVRRVVNQFQVNQFQEHFQLSLRWTFTTQESLARRKEGVSRSHRW